jgi:hypothetical protein
MTRSAVWGRERWDRGEGKLVKILTHSSEIVPDIRKTI